MRNRYFDTLRDPTEGDLALREQYVPNDAITQAYADNLQPYQFEDDASQNLALAAGFVQKDDGTFQTPMRDMANIADAREAALQRAYHKKFEETRNSVGFKVADTLADTGRMFLSPLLWLGGEDPTKYDPSYQLEAGYRKQFDQSEQFRMALYTKVNNARTARRDKAAELAKTARESLAPASSEYKKMRDFARRTNQLGLFNSGKPEDINSLNNQMMIMDGTAVPISGDRVLKGDMLTRLEGYGKDFTKLTTGVGEAYEAYHRLMTALTVPQSGPADIAAIFGFMKTLDPRSVVRESEFQVAAEAGGIWDKITNLTEKYSKGEVLPDAVRKEMAKLSTQLMESYKRTYDRNREDYEGRMGYLGFGAEEDINTFLGQRLTLPEFNIEAYGNTIVPPQIGGNSTPLRPEFIPQQVQSPEDYQIFEDAMKKYLPQGESN
jgi:hypothetical protein